MMCFFAQQSEAPRQTPDSVIPRHIVSNFPSGAGRASGSIYSGSGRVRNVIPGYGRVLAPGNDRLMIGLYHGSASLEQTRQ